MIDSCFCLDMLLYHCYDEESDPPIITGRNELVANKKKNTLSIPALNEISTSTPDKVETYGGKETARVSKSYDQPDGSTIKVTRKINKDNSITDKIEHKHM